MQDSLDPHPSSCPPPPLLGSKQLPESSAGSLRDKAVMRSSSSGSRGVLHPERIRRDKMAELYVALQNMVPNLFHRATRTRVVDGAIAYIKALEKVLEALEEKRKARDDAAAVSLLRTVSRCSVDVTVAGATSFFGLRSPARRGMVSEMLQVFEKHAAEVLAVTIACHGREATVTVTASCLDTAAVERIRKELMIMYL